MLNGKAPLLLFEFMPVSGLPESLSFLSPVVDFLGGVPVPIYLSERGIGVGLQPGAGLTIPNTGIVVDGESNAIDVETDIQPRYDANNVPQKPIVTQRGTGSVLTINLETVRDSLYTNVLFAMADIILAKTVQLNYRVSYFNRSTVVFRGLLHGMQSTVDPNDNKLRVTLQLQKPASVSPMANQTVFAVPRITGALPVGG